MLLVFDRGVLVVRQGGSELIKLEYSLKLKIKRNDWLPAANHCALF